ncbi:MAG: hypothetical protein RLW68_12435 [Devosia marina]|uniref:hypothetical protein n=1 Tax=Devosia marina TaxID=2683198 RepID=UPI0032F034CF
MNVVTDDMPFIALIDDDGHSAHLLTRMLTANGSPQVIHADSAEAGEAFLLECLSDIEREWPGLVIVDLKAHSGANLEFVTRHQTLLRQKGIPLAVMMQTTDRADRQAMQDAGAAAVFFRQAELEAYRREAAAIVSFWARNQRLDAVGM